MNFAKLIVGMFATLIVPANAYSGKTKVLGLEMGDPIMVFEGHAKDAFITCVRCSADGNWMASAGTDRKIRLWKMSTGKCVHIFEEAGDLPLALDFSLDSKYLAGGGSSKKVLIWDVIKGTCIQELKAHSETISVVRFSPDGKRLASGSHDESIIIWNVDKWSKELILKGPKSRTTSLSFSTDGKLLVSAGFSPKSETMPLSNINGVSSSFVRYWSLEKGELTKTLAVEARTAEFVAKGRMLACSGRSIDFKNQEGRRSIGAKFPTVLWDTLSDSEYTAWSCRGTNVRASRDGKWFATFAGHSNDFYSGNVFGSTLDGQDLEYCVWITHAVTGMDVCYLPDTKDYKYYFTALDFTADSQHVIAGGYKGLLAKWEIIPTINHVEKPKKCTEEELNRLWVALSSEKQATFPIRTMEEESLKSFSSFCLYHDLSADYLIKKSETINRIVYLSPRYLFWK